MKRIPLTALNLLLMNSGFIMATSDRFATDVRPIAYQRRLACAYNENYNVPNYNINKENNGDETNVADYAAMFTKALAHDATTSVATTQGQQSYETLVKAVKDGKQATYDAIVRASAGARKFVNPQCSAAWALIGRDSSLVPFTLPPTLDSRWAACEMAEVYLKAICRDVHFADYGTGQGTDLDPSDGQSITNKAVAVLNAYGNDYKGPKNGGVVDASVLFRGTAAGCLVGPYVSQFMWLDLHRLNQALLTIKQYVPISDSREFGVPWDDFIDIQDGLVPQDYVPSDFSGQRYAIDGRDIGTWVHNDLPADSYDQAFNILLNNGFPMAPNLPYYDGSTPNEDAFATMGPPDVSHLIGAITVYALKHAWAHKWRADRRLRPEAMAGLAHRVELTMQNPYGLNSDLFATLGGVNVMDWILSKNEEQDPGNPAYQTYLLPLMYPEGSPTHPSYPAGHAVIAGAATTVMKALIDDQALFKAYATPMKPNPSDPTTLIALSGEGEDTMTVGGELDKLASNIALARDFAGVHYRSDGDYGITLGETIAIYYLQDWARTYAEELFAGFELTKRDGTRIRITANEVVVIS